MLVQVFLGLILGNLYEWLIHKYLFHGLGKKKTSPFASHWRIHHKLVRKNQYFDENYAAFPKTLGHPFIEILQLTGLALLHIPLLWVVPYMVLTLWLNAGAYFCLHRYSHINVGWGKKWLPWHYDHHMGKDQDKNWCVTFPLMDYVLGTRKKYFK